MSNRKQKLARTRRQFTTEEMAALLRRHLVDKVPVADICDELKLQPSVFYQWLRHAHENPAAALGPPGSTSNGPSKREKERARDKFPGARPRIISDNGPQFMAKDFKEFIQLTGMTHVRTAPYYPQSNGEIERWHKTIKSDAIRPGQPSTLEEARALVTLSSTSSLPHAALRRAHTRRNPRQGERELVVTF